MVAVLIVVVVVGLLFYMMKNTASNSSSSTINSNVLMSFPKEDEATRLARVRANQEREDRLMKELDALIVVGDKAEITKWLEGYYNSGNKVPSKVYARAMTFIEDRKWLTEEEYQEQVDERAKENEKRIEELRKGEQETRVVYQVIASVVDVLLDKHKSDNDQSEEIERILEGFEPSEEFREGVLRFGYWHSMHIIMNSKKVPEQVAKRARSERQKTMGALTRKKITSVPIFEVKGILSGLAVELSSKDRSEYQNFAYVNHTRDFELPSPARQ